MYDKTSKTFKTKTSEDKKYFNELRRCYENEHNHWTLSPIQTVMTYYAGKLLTKHPFPYDIPDHDNPNYKGLPDNAVIAYKKNEERQRQKEMSDLQNLITTHYDTEGLPIPDVEYNKKNKSRQISKQNKIEKKHANLTKQFEQTLKRSSSFQNEPEIMDLFETDLNNGDNTLSYKPEVDEEGFNERDYDDEPPGFEDDEEEPPPAKRGFFSRVNSYVKSR